MPTAAEELAPLRALRRSRLAWAPALLFLLACSAPPPPPVPDARPPVTPTPPGATTSTAPEAGPTGPIVPDPAEPGAREPALASHEPPRPPAWELPPEWCPGLPQRLDRELALVVGAWNVRSLGDRTSAQRNYPRMADVVQEFDLIALQELEDPGHLRYLEVLMGELAGRGRAYSFWVSEPSGYAGNPEPGKGNFTKRCAFVWDTRRVRMLGLPAPIRPKIVNDPTFREVPFAADFEVTHGRGFDLRLANVHTVFNKEVCHLRRDEIAAVRDWLLEQAARSGEENVIAAGDFNSNPPDQPKRCQFFADLIRGVPGLRVPIFESRDAGEESVRTTVPRKDESAINRDYQRLPVYDHILISVQTTAALPPGPLTRAARAFDVLRFDDGACWAADGIDRIRITETMSDHRPVWVRLDYMAEDQDPD